MYYFRFNKRSGSLVIEAAISVMILSMAAAYIVNAHIDSSKSVKSRILNEDVTRNIENIKREIQYNVTKIELEEIFKYSEISLKYDEFLGRQLLNKRFDELDRGNDIFITMVSENERSMKFKVKAEIEKNGVQVEADDEFEKSWWMDED